MLQFNKLCIISRPPTILLTDRQNRLHCKEKSAICFKDGYEQHYVNGVFFPPELFNAGFVNKTITAQEIVQVTNTEQKALLIQEFGMDGIINHLDNAKILGTYRGVSFVDNAPVEYKLFEFDLDGVRVRYIQVEDHSQHKKTCISVPIEEQTETCMGAIAWTFEMTEEEYKPDIET